MLQHFANRYIRLLEGLLVLCLWVMVVMVLGNVILRYGFNSGITVSEELSRFFFVYLTFLGAIVAMHEGTHLGLDTLVRRLGPVGKKVCFVLAESLIVFCCVLMIYGTYRQHHINLTNAAPITELPMIYVYGVGYVTGVSIAVIALSKLYRMATGQLAESELIAVQDSEDQLTAHAASPKLSATATDYAKDAR